jgi:hypothetical protein
LFLIFGELDRATSRSMKIKSEFLGNFKINLCALQPWRLRCLRPPRGTLTDAPGLALAALNWP